MIDWTRLNTLRRDIGEDDFAEVAALFVAEISEHLDRLTAQPGQIGAADFHFLRGSAANLGFRALADACNSAEEECKSGTRPDIGAVAAIFQTSLAELGDTLPDLAA